MPGSKTISEKESVVINKTLEGGWVKKNFFMDNLLNLFSKYFNTRKLVK